MEICLLFSVILVVHIKHH